YAGIEPDAHTVATALTACSHAGALGRGAWVHEHLLSDDMLEDSYVASALINMYAKCGSIERATEVFESIQHRNRFVWSAMIGGFAVHGLADHAVECLRRMQQERMQPDGVIVLNVLSACAHAGLVSEGLQLLFEMEPRYDIVPQHEHYSCAVDMLCRVGRLDDALELIRKMPIRPLASVWGSLLTGCRLYGNVELAEMAVAELQGLTEDDEGVYVQLSDIYRDAGRLEDARRARRLVGRRGTKKTAAWSSVEVEGAARSFLAGDCVHPRRVEIGRMLELVTENISWNLDPLCRNIYDREIISSVMTE
ncbi:putative pentatricopeptide repeat-containing protein At3g28640, partial [Asparagus officinalis]|uniref:putative pentatricopeptide repeat-containing protein At3g28640 n=1 Tax=Asparagus officinalis TaxID=4686 RepID=UPI00098E5DE2